jgi:hypothetical protein
MAGADPRTLKPLIALDLIPDPVGLEASIRDRGLLEPLKVRAGVVADGLRRLKVVLRLGLPEVPVMEIGMEPHAARVHLNLGRPWTPAELACWYGGAPEALRDAGLKWLGKYSTPELKKGLGLLIACPTALSEAAADHINLGMVKDLVLLGPHAPEALERLARTEATVGQRREMAFLLKILFLQNKKIPYAWPLHGDKAIALLKSRARPELEAHLARFRSLLEQLSMRKCISVHPPEAFEEPGFFLNLHVTSENIQEILDFFDRNADALRNLAAMLP